MWAKGLLAAVIGGVSNSFLSAMGIVGANAVGVKIDQLTPKQIGSVCLSGGLVGLFLYLKQSPVPPNGDTQIITKP